MLTMATKMLLKSMDLHIRQRIALLERQPTDLDKAEVKPRVDELRELQKYLSALRAEWAQ